MQKYLDTYKQMISLRGFILSETRFKLSQTETGKNKNGGSQPTFLFFPVIKFRFYSNICKYISKRSFIYLANNFSIAERLFFP